MDVAPQIITVPIASIKPMLAAQSSKINLLNFNKQQLEQHLVSIGEPAFRARQILQWIYHHGVTDPLQMTDLSKSLRERLARDYEVRPLTIIKTSVSDDGTIKWLMGLDDGNCVETVFIPESGRGTLCVSSQVGCSLNCRFCATGSQGFNRDLSLAEIIGQVWLAKFSLAEHAITPEKSVTNVVMMGMGEPLLNYNNVLSALNLMLDDLAFGLSKYRVTLSTSGVVPVLRQLAQDSEVALAVSLHAPNDELRDELVPINKKYPLKMLMAACRDHFGGNKKRLITMEYVMLAGVNDTPQHARQLIKLLRDVPAKMNLIPFNPFPNARYQCSSWETIDEFRLILMKSGLHTMTRKTRGDDIAAACGQLAGEFRDKTRRRQRLLKEHLSARGAE